MLLMLMTLFSLMTLAQTRIRVIEVIKNDFGQMVSTK